METSYAPPLARVRMCHTCVCVKHVYVSHMSSAYVSHMSSAYVSHMLSAYVTRGICVKPVKCHGSRVTWLRHDITPSELCQKRPIIWRSLHKTNSDENNVRNAPTEVCDVTPLCYVTGLSEHDSYVGVTLWRRYVSHVMSWSDITPSQNAWRNGVTSRVLCAMTRHDASWHIPWRYDELRK